MFLLGNGARRPQQRTHAGHLERVLRVKEPFVVDTVAGYWSQMEEWEDETWQRWEM